MNDEMKVMATIDGCKTEKEMLAAMCAALVEIEQRQNEGLDISASVRLENLIQSAKIYLNQQSQQ